MERVLNLQSSDGENRCQSYLLSATEIEAANNRHWKDDYSEIRHNIYSCISTTLLSASNLYSQGDIHLQPHGKLVDALCVLPCPECSHRDASKDAAENCPDGVHDHNTQRSPACDLNSLRGEDSLILEKD
jgi:hypothetical protein